LHPIEVLDRDEADWFRSQYDSVTAMLGGAPKAIQMTQVHRFYGWAWELASHPAVLNAVESVLGPDILLWSAQVFPKPARDSGYITMHQDGTYWGLDGGEVTTAWIALTASTRENGCMRLLPGSHRSAILPHNDTFATDNLLTRGQEVQAEYDEKDVVDIELKPGQMSLHHVRAIHGSRSNPSDTPRIGFAIRYMTPEVRPVRPGESAALVRGVDRCGNWVLRSDPPAFPSLQSAVRAHQAEAERFVAKLTRD
jgi:ectoine hydroxylase-related dioxygenase (phytanoyl-CoA dioxygenase family)